MTFSRSTGSWPKLLDMAAVSADRCAHRAARVASDMIESDSSYWEQARPRVSEAGRRRWEARGTCAINGAGASRTVPVTEHE